jgi:hypothetical protein
MERADPPPHLRAAASWLVFALVALAHLVFARLSVAVPYVFGDEAGYLTKAAALAGLRTDAYSSYYPGYSLLLAPLYGIEPHTQAIYDAVQILNALLAGVTAVLLFGLARELAPRQSPLRQGAAALAATSYAPFMAFSAFALSENLFLPLVAWLGLRLVRQLRQPTRGSVPLIGLAGAWLMLTHPKAAAVIAALYGAWMVGVWRERRRLEPLLALAVTGALFVTAHHGLDALFRQRLGYYADGVTGHYPAASTVLRDVGGLLSLDGITAFGLNLAGQLFYLGVASAGLLLVGAGMLWASWFQRRAPPQAAETRVVEIGYRAYALFALLSLAFTLLMTAFFMQHGPRVDHLFYGRYDEGVAMLLLLPALMRPSSRYLWTAAAAAVAALGLLLVFVRGAVIHGEVVQLSIIGMQLWNAMDPGAVGLDRIDLAFIAVAGTLSTLCLGAFARRPVLPWLAAALFLAGAVAASRSYLRPESDTNARKVQIVDYIHRHFPDLRCVDYDIRRGDYWSRFNYQVTLLPIRQHESAVGPLWPGVPEDGRSHARCSDLVISTYAGMDRRYREARLLVQEAGSEERLWLIPR